MVVARGKGVLNRTSTFEIRIRVYEFIEDS